MTKFTIPRSDNTAIMTAEAAFPPPEVAEFLLQIFFEQAQTNYYYLDEEALRQKLEHHFLYPKALANSDSAWVCTALMVFATATQFAHLSSKGGSQASSDSHSEDRAPEDNVAVGFYNAANSLLPNIISSVSIESVQACLLLAMYTLPLDPAGISFTYIGLAIKMAIRQGMHKNYPEGAEPRADEVRRRVWWTTYSLER